MSVVHTITLAPGAATGWHYHPGRVEVLVLSGTLTRTLADGSVEVSTVGQSLVEQAGPRHVHIGRNLGVVPVVLVATYLRDDGGPLAVEVPAPQWSPATGAAETEGCGKPE